MRSESGGLFDEHFQLEKISKQNDPLEKLLKHIDFELFCKPLEDYFRKRSKANHSTQTAPIASKPLRKR